MMNLEKKKQIERLEETLKSAYGKNNNVELGEAWQLGVMREIRSLKEPSSNHAYPKELFRFAWRFAIAGASLACILIVYYFASGSSPEMERAEQIIIDPGRSMTSQTWSF